MKFVYGVLGILSGSLTLACVVMTIPVYDNAVGGLTTGKGQQWYYAMMLVVGAVVFLVAALYCLKKYRQKVSRQSKYY